MGLRGGKCQWWLLAVAAGCLAWGLGLVVVCHVLAGMPLRLLQPSVVGC